MFSLSYLKYVTILRKKQGTPGWGSHTFRRRVPPHPTFSDEGERTSVQIGPSEGPLAVGGLSLGEYHLRQTKLTIAEPTLGPCEPEVPHAVERLVEHLDDPRTVLAMCIAPHTQSLRVVLPQVLTVDRPQTVRRQPVLDLGDSRQVSSGENVLVDPCIHRPRPLLCDRVEQRNATVNQQLRNLAEVLITVAAPHVLEHADAHDPIERLAGRQVLVVHEFESHQVRHTLTLCQFTCAGQLCRAERNAQHSRLVLLGGGDGQVTPAATDVEQPHARLKPQLAEHVIDLLVLRLLQAILRVLEVRTRVRTGRVEEQLVVVVTHTVVGLDVALLSLLVVAVTAERLTYGHRRLIPSHQLEEQRELVFTDLELPVGVSLADSEARVDEHPPNHAWILDSDPKHRLRSSVLSAVATNRVVPERHLHVSVAQECTEHLMCQILLEHFLSLPSSSRTY